MRKCSEGARRFLRGALKIKAGLASAAVTAVICGSSITAAPQNARTLALYNIHTKETTTVLYKKDGQFIQSALEKINWAFRDWRKDEATQMDPKLVDLLWEMHAELGSREPIHIISGYRSRGTNDMLRKSVGGQASESRHILGKAADVHFPDVPLKALRYSALVRERGGVGYYPTSAIPFVHVDTDRVRHWPRLPRYELALLFPNGSTKHQPADGDSITIEDVRVAKARHKDLAVQVAAFHNGRTRGQPGIAVAALGGNPQASFSQTARTPNRVAALEPRLLEQPRPVDRPDTLRPSRPSASDQGKLTAFLQNASFPSEPRLVSPPAPATRTRPSEPPRVASLTPLPQPDSISDLIDGNGWANGFVQAPAYDEEHPEELSYRPFPIAPLMTQTSSADDPALIQLVHPDFKRALELLDQAGGQPPMHLRPAEQVAALMWAQQFKGEAVNLSALVPSTPPNAQRASGLVSRPVRTQ